ncbi:D-glycero-beta-D-manno-heptose-7-phosphate kinase [Kerstersia gyiorum]|uniref:D-glycero-beta-D-manno-heptose-7-phosphate kinase n=1 Tax=Kerstersia gyiorum TaxID=206506 RepID=UPI0010713D97|nr:D-glycero-beta-D-manno-heptose-7-phosphate kinase [Kerstersia gyiorum]QBR41457.1 D-glycero-beta-D-manno-heptose-7-phosphate kinase [Kerstersia gyiorum]
MNVFPVDAVKRARILIVGDLMLDRYWFGEVERISPEAPVPVVRVARREDRLGGAANVARNVAALGSQACVVGVVGEDEPGRRIAGLLDEAGIASALVRTPDCPTTLKLRVLGRQQQLLRIDFEETLGVSVLRGIRDQVDTLLAGYDVLVLSDYAKGALAEVEVLIERARAAGVPILVDPKGDDFSRYRGADLVTPNRQELQVVAGAWRTEEDLTRRAQALRQQLGLRGLMLTRSEQGMSLYTDEGEDHVAAQAHEVFDVSGAGDTVLATLAVMRAAGMDWHQAMRWANKAGGIVVGKLGTSIVTAEEMAAAV